MGDKRINIDGEEYISSARAAELVGYTKDYVGQLARGGKIEAKRVGRNWYIKESSINQHKLSVHYTLTKPKKTRKEKRKDDEITTFTVDNSAEISKRDNVAPKHIESIEPEIRKSPQKTIKRQEFESAHDLFPKPKRRKADVLSKTDISFEKTEIQHEPVATHTDKYQQVSFNKEKEQARIRMRKDDSHQRYTTKPRQVRRMPRHDVGLDGVVIQGIRRESVHEQRNIHRRSVQTNPNTQYHYEEPVTKNDYFEEVDQPLTKRRSTRRSTGSKTIPVIGAIILFTIVVVIYILFFSSP